MITKIVRLNSALVEVSGLFLNDIMGTGTGTLYFLNTQLSNACPMGAFRVSMQELHYVVLLIISFDDTVLMLAVLVYRVGIFQYCC